MNLSGGNRMTACVTGASGMIGRRIVHKLLARGYRVRVLTRSKFRDARVQIFNAGFSDEVAVERFISGADMVFHCAAELRDETKMRESNVLATESIVRFIGQYQIKYFCHLSSANVIGNTSQKWVDEETLCSPYDTYGMTKLEAEEIARSPIPGCSTVILRPTTVVDENRVGDLILPIRDSYKSRLKVFFRGGECAHIVHAEDVAEAAMFFISRLQQTPRIFFVSLDDDPLNTVANVWSLYRAKSIGSNKKVVSPFPHLPVAIPHIRRRMMRRVGNCGAVRYTAKRLVSEGFTFAYGVKETVEKIMEDRALFEVA